MLCNQKNQLHYSKCTISVSLLYCTVVLMYQNILLGVTRNRKVATSRKKKKKSLLSLQSFGHFGVLLTLQNLPSSEQSHQGGFDVPPFGVGASSAPENNCSILKRSVMHLFRCCFLFLSPLSCDTKASPHQHMEQILERKTITVLATEMITFWKQKN